MATSAISGKVGAVYNGAVQLAGFYSWELTYSIEALEATDFGSAGWREFITALTGWKASAKRWFQVGQTNLVPGTTYTIRFYVDKSEPPVGGKYLTGSCIVTARTPSVSVEGIVGDDIEFTPTGVLTPVGF